jgi:glycerophosphoryl diester phosphodiesterase
VDALSLARARGLVANVEMKRDVPDRRAVVRAMARVLGSWDPAHPVIVSSFDPLMLAALRVAHPKAVIGLLVTRGNFREHTAIAARPPLADAIHLDRTLTSPPQLRSIERRGVLVNVWTVNDPGEARDLSALGVDGLITDTPAATRAALTAS